MKPRYLLFGALLALNTAASSVDAAGFTETVKDFFWKEEAPLPKVKVLVNHDQPQTFIEVKGKYKVYDPSSMTYLTSRFSGKRGFLNASHFGIKWGEEFPGVHQLMIVPDSADTVIQVDDKIYSGTLYVYDVGGSISIVNELSIEDYLMAILTPVFQQDIPEEALAAIAIAARTQTYYYSIIAPKNKYWAIDGMKTGFNGLKPVCSGDMAAAIRSTERMILSKTGAYEGVTPFPAYWTALGFNKPHANESVSAKISLTDADGFARKGKNAAQILLHAFPNTTIMLAH